MDSSEYKRKFKALFEKLLHNKFELSDKHSEDLLKYLDGSQDKCVAKILETPFFANLLVSAIKNCEFASTSVKIFFSKVVSIVLSNEVLFNRFVQMQGSELLMDRSQAERNAQESSSERWLTLTRQPELWLAMSQQTMALVAHYSGVMYVVKKQIHHRILLPHTRYTPAIAEILYNFLAKLIWKLNEYEEEAALLEILQYIVDPLLASPLSDLTKEAESYKVQSESLLSSVHALVHVLGEVEHLVKPNNVVSILSQVFSIENKLTTALERTRDPLLAQLLAEATLRYYYAASRQVAMLRPDFETRVNQEFHEAVNKILSSLIKKQSLMAVLKFLRECHAFWHKVEGIVVQVAFEKFGKIFLLQNHFILLLLMPLYLKQKYVKRLVYDPVIEDATEIFHSNLASSFPYDLVGTAYNFKALIMESMSNNLSLACTYSLRELLRLKRMMSQHQACLVFKTLFYTLSEFVLSDGSNLVLLGNPLRTPDDELFLGHVLEAIAMLLEEHEINWHETLEIVELQAVLVNLIKQNILSVKLLVQALELVRTCVCKLLSPELTLLMRPQRGGSLSEAGGAARAVLLRPESDARFAALQLILSFLEVAYVKFMPLRGVISAHGLLTEAARIACADPDARAQAAALRCLDAGARCEDLWTEVLEGYQNLYEKLVNIMRYSRDGEVRKEAAAVLVQVYVNRKVSDAFTRRVSRAMARAATEDPHWPVQLAALRFWKQLLKKLFTDKGMIDGTFPSVTFCKEKRKIIVLNDKEIHKLLEIIMGNLSTNGCLAVLVKCMNSSNSELSEKSYRLSHKLVNGLDQYKFTGVSNRPETTINLHTPSPEDNEVDQAKRPRSSNSMELEDSDLISEIFECLSTKSSPSESSSPIEVMHPSEFIKQVREATKRRPTNTGLGTLIDELLTL